MPDLVLGYSVDFTDGELGRGGFGTVFKGLDRDKNAVAIKKVSKEHKSNASTEAYKSYSIKNKINHNQIVKIYDVKTWKNSMWIIMEYCELGDLDQFFKRHTATVERSSHQSEADEADFTTLYNFYTVKILSTEI